MNIQNMIKAFEGMATTADEQSKQGSFKLINLPKLETLSSLKIDDLYSQLSTVDAEITVKTDTGTATFTLSEFHSLYNGMVKVWPIAKPAKVALAAKRQELVVASSADRKAAIVEASAAKKEATSKARAEKQAAVAAAKELKATERAKKLQVEAAAKVEKLKEKADAAAAKAKADAKAAIDKAEALAAKVKADADAAKAKAKASVKPEVKKNNKK